LVVSSHSLVFHLLTSPPFRFLVFFFSNHPLSLPFSLFFSPFFLFWVPHSRAFWAVFPFLFSINLSLAAFLQTFFFVHLFITLESIFPSNSAHILLIYGFCMFPSLFSSPLLFFPFLRVFPTLTLFSLGPVILSFPTKHPPILHKVHSASLGRLVLVPPFTSWVSSALLPLSVTFFSGPPFPPFFLSDYCFYPFPSDLGYSFTSLNLYPALCAIFSLFIH